MKISIANTKDIEQLCNLLAHLFDQEVEFKPDKSLQVKGLEKIINSSDYGEILIAKEEELICGMVNLLYTVSTALGSRVALLEDMIVLPEYRNKGIGSALMEEAIFVARQKGCGRITLLTDDDNAKAHDFYKRHGFQQSSMCVFRKAL